MSQAEQPTPLQNEPVKYERLTECSEITNESKFKIEIPDIKQFTAIIDSMRFMIEGNILLSERGFEIRGYPPNKAQLIDLCIPAEDFTVFECNQNMKLGIQYDDFHAKLKRVRADDIVTLEFEILGATAYLQIRCVNEQSSKTFGVPLSDIELLDYLPVENIPVETSFFLDSSTLKEIISDNVGSVERLIFNGSEKGLTVDGATSDNNTPYKLFIPADQLTRFVVTKETRTQYQYENISQLINPMTPDMLVKVSFANNMPMVLEHIIYETGNCAKIVAPRLF